MGLKWPGKARPFQGFAKAKRLDAQTRGMRKAELASDEHLAAVAGVGGIL